MSAVKDYPECRDTFLTNAQEVGFTEDQANFMFYFLAFEHLKLDTDD